SLWRLPVSLLPTLERPRLEITARDRERSRDELEAQVARPLERRLTTLGGVIDVTSTIDDGEVRLVLETEWQTDIDRLRIEVERRLVGEATTNLEALSVDVDSGDGQPILRIAVQGASATRSTAFADQVLLPELSRLEGAGRIGLVGAADLRPVVAPRAADLFAHGLVPGDLVQGLAAVGRDRPLGRLSHGGTLRPVLVRQPVRDLEALERLEVTPAGLRLADVADITLGEVPRGGLARVDGAAAVVVEVFRAPGANAVRLAREAREVVSELAPRAGALQIFVFDDGSREVTASLLQLAQAGLIGLALGTLILRLLLGSFRQAVAMVVVVPVSILAAFSAFLVADVSLDLISLAGLALAAGMLVDNSIVVLESIASARERRSGRPVLAGSRQIAMALVASFLTTAVVFVPLIYLRGLARAFFGVQAFAIVSTLALSLALSLTLTPVLARWDRRGGSAPGRGGRQPGRSLYLKALERGLENPWPGLAATLALLAGVFALVPQLPRELVPSGVSRVLVAEIALPPGLESAEAEKRLLSLERALAAALSRGAVEPAGWSILQRSAAPKLRRSALGVAESLGSPTEAQMTLHFESPELLERALPEVRRAAQAVPGLRVRLARRQGAVSSAVVRAASQLEIELTASTTRRLASLRRSAVALLTEDGWSPREGSWDERAGRPAWWLRFEPARLAELELSPGLLVT
ncbi:MAG: efflux RND transporter permease subunit, partial [Acidobacteriota bacterium]